MYKAVHKLTGQKVAIKSISKHGKGAVSAKAFRREHKIMKAMHHSNIARYLGYAETRKEVWLIMELADSKSLARQTFLFIFKLALCS